MKKVLAIVLSICFILCLTACNKDNTVSDVMSDNSQITSIESNSSEPTESSKPDVSVHTHSYSNATCIEAAKCFCGATDGDALGHNYSKATCTEVKKCSRCGVTSGSALGHRYSNATCTEAKKCSRCGITDGSALGHSYNNATCTEPEKCSRCDETKGNKLGHSYSNNVCVRCEKKLVAEAFGYSVGDIATARNSEGESYTMKYLGDDRWEDQNGHIWTSYEYKDGTMHWNSFFS